MQVPTGTHTALSDQAWHVPRPAPPWLTVPSPSALSWKAKTWSHQATKQKNQVGTETRTKEE